MGNNCCFPFAASGVRKTIGDPAFKWKIHGFSSLLERGAISANSGIFHCCGYTWFLKVYPRHNKDGSATPNVHLCLVLDRTSFKPGYVMKVEFKLSIYNQTNGVYHAHKASYHFDVMDTHSKKICLIPLEELMNTYDFRVDDSCVFGAEILKLDVFSLTNTRTKSVVVKSKSTTARNVFLQKKQFTQGSYKWHMNNFLDLNSKSSVLSPTFEVGGHKWHIKMYPHGDMYSKESLSLYLKLHDSDELSVDSGMMIEVLVSILDQKHLEHYTFSGRFTFLRKGSWGWSNFIRLEKLKDSSKGYLVGSSCVVDAKITIIGSSSDA